MPPAPRVWRGCSLALLLGLLVLPPASAGAWGFAAHRLVNEEAARTLPDPLRELFVGNIASLREHSIDPDLWKVYREGEKPNHYLNLDAFDDLAAGSVPGSEAAHLKRHGDPAVGDGRIPWRVGEAYQDLVAAFRARDAGRVLQQAAVLGHYVADAHGPLHATANYDGQLSGQDGVHARWEIELFDRYESQLAVQVTAGEAEPVGDPVMLTFDVLRRSLELAADTLAADRESAGRWDYVETETDDRYDAGYYSRLYAREAEAMATRLGEAARAVGSLWLSAWQKAGRPSLDWSFREPFVRGESRLVVAFLDGVGAALVDAAADRGALPHLDALRREGSVGRVLLPFPSRPAATQATLWTGAWPMVHGVVGDGAPHPSGSVLETTPGGRSTALGAEPFWVTVARDGVETVVVGVPQAAPFAPFLGDRRFGGDFGEQLRLLAADETGIEAAVLDAGDLQPRGATSWTGEIPPSSLEVTVPVGGGALPGLLFDDPDDPAGGLDSLALSATRRLGDAVVVKPVADGREEDAFATVRLPTDNGPVSVYVRLFRLAPDGRDIVLWHSAGARPLTSRALVTAAAAQTGGLLPGGSADLYSDGRFGPVLWNGGDGTAERRYLETVRLAVRQHSRVAALVLDRTRWGLAILSLPLAAEPLRLWAGRLDPDLPGHDAATAVRLRPFLDEALRLIDGWIGEIARRNPPDAALAIVGGPGIGGIDRVARPNVALRAAGLLVTGEEGAVDLARTKAVYSPANGALLVMNSDTRPEGIQPRKGSSLVEAASIGAMREMRDPATGEAAIAELLAPGKRGAPAGIGGPTGGFLYLRPAAGVVLSPETAGPIVERVAPRGEAFDPSAKGAAGIVVLTGRGVAAGRALGEVAAIDLAPTFTTLLGVGPPAQATGQPLSRALGNGAESTPAE